MTYLNTAPAQTEQCRDRVYDQGPRNFDSNLNLLKLTPRFNPSSLVGFPLSSFDFSSLSHHLILLCGAQCVTLSDASPTGSQG